MTTSSDQSLFAESGRPGVRIRRRRLGMGLRDRIVSTVAAILCFFGGLARVGPSAASILSTLEPLVTVALAAAAFGESLGVAAGGRRRTGACGRAGDAVAGAPACDVCRRRARGRPGRRHLRPLRREGTAPRRRSTSVSPAREQSFKCWRRDLPTDSETGRPRDACLVILLGPIKNGCNEFRYMRRLAFLGRGFRWRYALSAGYMVAM